jgi:phosphatidylinositol 4-kinase A
MHFFSLELNIHQRILSDIASNVGEAKEDVQHAQNLIMPMRASDTKETGEADDGLNLPPMSHDEQRVFMVRLRRFCILRLTFLMMSIEVCIESAL